MIDVKFTQYPSCARMLFRTRKNDNTVFYEGVIDLAILFALHFPMVASYYTCCSSMIVIFPNLLYLPKAAKRFSSTHLVTWWDIARNQGTLVPAHKTSSGFHELWHMYWTWPFTQRLKHQEWGAALDQKRSALEHVCAVSWFQVKHMWPSLIADTMYQDGAWDGVACWWRHCVICRAPGLWKNAKTGERRSTRAPKSVSKATSGKLRKFYGPSKHAKVYGTLGFVFNDVYSRFWTPRDWRGEGFKGWAVWLCKQT